MANTYRIEDTHYRSRSSKPGAGRGSSLLSRLGVWLLLSVIAAVVVVAGLYFTPLPRSLTIKPGEPQPMIAIPHAQPPIRNL
jgi:hypothetical protein